MKIIVAEKLKGTEREVCCPKGGFVSLRLLLERDGMGFSMTQTTVPVGDKQYWCYANHLEACFCITGTGILTDLATGKTHIIEPGTCYVLDENDEHEFQAIDEVTLICVFNPPLKGREVHDETGSYPK